MRASILLLVKCKPTWIIANSVLQVAAHPWHPNKTFALRFFFALHLASVHTGFLDLPDYVTTQIIAQMLAISR